MEEMSRKFCTKYTEYSSLIFGEILAKIFRKLWKNFSIILKHFTKILRNSEKILLECLDISVKNLE